jgi:hypothetical protein
MNPFTRSLNKKSEGIIVSDSLVNFSSGCTLLNFFEMIEISCYFWILGDEYCFQNKDSYAIM